MSELSSNHRFLLSFYRKLTQPDRRRFYLDHEQQEAHLSGVEAAKGFVKLKPEEVDHLLHALSCIESELPEHRSVNNKLKELKNE